ncbi:MAG: STAS domain-containing protein [Deltaproteobacteria bacterium]|nr:STAS domain-containing protein [Deltaproteobacteria bacterium]
MFEYTITEFDSIKHIIAKGRIDALSASDTKKMFDDLIIAGERILLVDLTEVNYVSSAGLRTFILIQKELKKADGQIFLHGLADQVLEIFRMSGLTSIFSIITDKEEIRHLIGQTDLGPQLITRETDGLLLEFVEGEAGKGRLSVVGSQDKMETSSYTEKDVVPVPASSMPFGCGLAALGDSYDEYKGLFGECLIINGSFFFYPALRYSSVDYLIEARRDPALSYKFLHGFGFNGTPRYLLSFAGRDQALDLSSLMAGIFSLSQADAVGITFLAETKGFWGMHAKKVPLTEQKPINGRGIFDPSNFADWIDFPVEPAFVNHIVAAAGLGLRGGVSVPDELAKVVSPESHFHLHGGIFDQVPIGRNPQDFDREMMRVFSDLRVHKVQHILGRSRFSAGLAAVFEIEV